MTSWLKPTLNWWAVRPILRAKGWSQVYFGCGRSKGELMTGASSCSASQVSLTIAIPAYNRSNAVQALLKEICNQVEHDDEVIVSDDGSTDGTAEQASKVHGVKVIRHERNQGMVANWNACLDAATRDWICIIHDDDRLEPGALAALRRACVLAAGPALILHQYSKSQFEGGFRCRYLEPGPEAVLSCPNYPSGAVLHRRILEAVGPFDPHYQYSADLEYFPRITARFPLIVIESPRVVEYRRHGANYHFQTSRSDDYYVRYEELLGSILSYAGIEEEQLRRDILEKRLVGDIWYMLDTADRLGDRRLVRHFAKCCERFPHRASVKEKVIIRIAAMTGWRPRRHRLKPFEPLES
jgi:glycosyltransferase involved in cell wall biosynthesis